MKRTMSVPEWHRLAQEGAVPPMRILLHGWSMAPLIRINMDYVTIVQIDALPAIGDIVLFSDPKLEGRYVVHRVWKKKEDKVMTWGDNCSRPDGWIPLDYVWGKVVLIERGNRTIRPHPMKGFIWALFCHPFMAAFRFLIVLKQKIRKKEQ